MSKIVILGGHGAVAMIAGRKLVEAGHQVTSVIRSADQKTGIEAIGATPLVLDLQEASTEQLDATTPSCGPPEQAGLARRPRSPWTAMPPSARSTPRSAQASSAT